MDKKKTISLRQADAIGIAGVAITAIVWILLCKFYQMGVVIQCLLLLPVIAVFLFVRAVFKRREEKDEMANINFGRASNDALFIGMIILGVSGTVVQILISEFHFTFDFSPYISSFVMVYITVVLLVRHLLFIRREAE